MSPSNDGSKLPSSQPVGPVIPVSELERVYRTLPGQVAQLEIAEAYTRHHGRLASEFLASVDQMASFPTPSYTFYSHDREPGGIAETSEAASPGLRTVDIARKLEESGGCELDGHRCWYVDRELRPLRTTGGATYREPFREGALPASARGTPLLDLLMLASDGTPAIVEVKLASDQNLFYALIQALMHAAALSTLPQRTRLAQHAAEREHPGVPSARRGGPLDVLLAVFDEPHHSPPRRQLGEHARTIATATAADERLRPFIRRIAKVQIGDDLVTWTTDWEARVA